LLLLARSPSI